MLASPFPNPGLILLGLNNGRSAYSIHQELVKLGLPVKLDWVERLVAGYSSKFAGISEWRQASVANARANKQVRTKIGGMIHIPDNATDTSLFCLPVQTNGADGFKLALCLISRGLEGIDARIVNILHNEMVVEARDGIEDQVQAIVKESIEEALERIIPEVAFAVEIRMALAWG